MAKKELQQFVAVRRAQFNGDSRGTAERQYAPIVECRAKPFEFLCDLHHDVARRPPAFMRGRNCHVPQDASPCLAPFVVLV